MTLAAIADENDEEIFKALSTGERFGRDTQEAGAGAWLAQDSNGVRRG